MGQVVVCSTHLYFKIYLITYNIDETKKFTEEVSIAPEVMILQVSVEVVQ